MKERKQTEKGAITGRRYGKTPAQEVTKQLRMLYFETKVEE